MSFFLYQYQRLTICALAVFLGGVLWLAVAEAQTNPQINYQGKLTASSSVAVADGNYNMRFWLLASSTAPTSTAIWAESYTAGNRVAVTNGLFSVMLGSQSPLTSVDFNQTLFLGVEIGGATTTIVWDGEMSPRKILGSVPAAFEARRLGGVASSSFLRSDEADTMQATSSNTLLSLVQDGAGAIARFFSGVTEVFTILANGNVGVGTSTPSHQFTVAGNARITGALIDSTNASGTSGMILSATGSGTNWLATSSLGLSSSFTTSAHLAALLSDETGTGASVFGTGAVLSSTTLSGTTYMSGSVGIGSTSPSARLSIVGTAGSDMLRIASSTGSTTLALLQSGNLELPGQLISAGINWTARSAAGNNDFWSAVTYGNGRFVAVGRSGDRVMYSPDGVNWATTTAAGDNDFWTAVTYGNGLFVAVGDSGTDRVMTSPDGINWTLRSAAGNDDSWYSVTYGNGLFVAVAWSGDNLVMTSPDGINWTPRSAADDNDNWYGVTYGGGLFVAVADSSGVGDAVMTSTDGINWTPRSAAGNDDNWTSVTYGNGLFVAVSVSAGDSVMTSLDGINWTARSAAGGNDSWYGVTYGNGLFVAVSQYSSDRVMTSSDGITWTVRAAANNNDSWSGLTYGNGVFVVVGNDGVEDVMTSGYTHTSALAANNLFQGDHSFMNRLGVGTTSSAASLFLQSQAGVNPFTIASSTGSTLLTVNQSGFLGIGTSSPSYALSVAGDLRLTGTFRDTNNASGTSGMILSATGSGTSWLATSSLGLGNGSFIGLSDTDQSSFTANRLLFTNSGGTGLTDSASLVFDGTNLGIGTSTPVASVQIAGNSAVRPSLFDAGNLSLASDQNVFVILDTDNTQSNRYFSLAHNAMTTGGATEVGRWWDTGRLSLGTTTMGALIEGQGISGTNIVNLTRNTGVPVFTIVNNTGFVGIGSSTPSSELSVGGKITLSSTTIATDSPLGTMAWNGVDLYAKATTTANGWRSLTQANEVDVFIIAGQSNAVASAGSTTLATVIPSGISKVYYDGDVTEVINDLPVGNGGPWPAFALRYWQLTGKRVFFVQTAVGGTGILEATDSGNGDWSSADTLFATSTEWTRDALNDFAELGYIPTLKGVLWSQGENDATYINSSGITAAQYRAGLEDLIGRYRAEFGSTTPFYLFRTGTHVTASDGGYRAVRQEQENVAATDPDTYIVFRDSVDYVARGMMADNVHYSQYGYNDMGRTGAEGVVMSRGLTPMWASVSDALMFNVNASSTNPRVLIGAVGIATTTWASSSFPVEIVGDVNRSVNPWLSLTGYGNTPALYLRRANTSSQAPTATLSGNVLGAIRATGATSTSAFNQDGYNAAVEFLAAENQTATNQGSHISFFTTPLASAGAQERMRLTASGYLGIGTSSPSYALSVAGDLRLTGTFRDTNNASGTSGMILSATGSGTSWLATSSLGLGNGSFIGLSDTDQSSFTANRLLFTNSGGTGLTDSASLVFDGTNLGIGSTTPGTRLTIALNSLAATGTATGTALTINDDTNSNAWSLVNPWGAIDFRTSDLGANKVYSRIANVMTSVTGNTARLGIFSADGAGGTLVERLSLLESGHFGIGTTTPATLLHLYGSTNASRGITIQNNNAGSLADAYVSWIVGHTAQQYSLGIDNSNSDAFTLTNGADPSTGTALLTVTSGGNVGIGTTSPVATLALVATSGTNPFVVASSTGAQLLTLTQAGLLGLGSTTPEGQLSMRREGITGTSTVGIDQYIGLANATNAATQFGNRMTMITTNTATTTIVGSILRITDSTAFGNTLRGLEVQAQRGTNTLGENTALSGFARTFGVRGTTEGDAGAVFEPAGIYGETRGTTQGNALRGYSSSITTATLLSLFQASSSFAGTGLEMSFGNSGGTFSSTSSRFLDFKVSGTSRFVVNASGTVTIGDGTNQAGLQIGKGGLCVDSDGSCTASTSGRISATEYHTGNSDLAEMYFSDDGLKAGEIVALVGGLSVDRASTQNREAVIGVVSTMPGLILGADDSSLRNTEKAYPIGLSGRVPIRLSNENGPIKKGDHITLSSLPGVGMRASSSGIVVGIALEDFDQDKAYSETFVNQFGENLIIPEFPPFVPNDPRISDGCYYGAGTESGAAPCVPLKATSTDGQQYEAAVHAAEEAKRRALTELRRKESTEVELVDGREVKVGQIVMFIQREYRYLDDTQLAMMAALASTSTEAYAPSDAQAPTLFDRMAMLASSFMDGVLSIFKLDAEEVKTDKLCVGETCVDEAMLRQLLERSNNEGEIMEASPAPQKETNDSNGGESIQDNVQGDEEGAVPEVMDNLEEESISSEADLSGNGGGGEAATEEELLVENTHTAITPEPVESVTAQETPANEEPGAPPVASE